VFQHYAQMPMTVK